MSLVEMNWNPGRTELRRFSAIWLPAFLVVSGALLFRSSRLLVIPSILGSAALVSVALGLWAPIRMKPVYVGLNVVALPFGWLASHAILVFVYFLVITPVGLARRILGRDSLSRSFDRTAKSYWLPRKRPHGPERWFRQY
jgi:hypothetical protein